MNDGVRSETRLEDLVRRNASERRSVRSYLLDLAVLYGTSARRLNEQVKRNLGRFPTDFTFRLTQDESENSVP
ncbi:MAG: ORF6N domain-containing protein [Bdellovibrionota bacterium]